jgi:putative transport protein
MIDLLARNPLLLLFVTCALGYAVGRIRVRGASLGVAAVLFVGLAIGSLHPDLKVPDFAFTFGLAVFVYTIGLSSGAGFFASFSRKGLRDNVFVVAVLVLGAALVVAGAAALALRPTVAAGVFAGSLTNTPALAGVLELVKGQAPGAAEALLNEPVVGYSVTYPMGVLGPILAVTALRALYRIDYRREAERLEGAGLVQESIANVTVRVTNPEVAGCCVRDLHRTRGLAVVMSRVQHGDRLGVADGDTVLALGDRVVVVGHPDDVARASRLLGEEDPQRLDADRSAYDVRRIVVSRKELVGRRIRDLDLPERYGTVVTRVRKGDIDLVASGDTVLELGDRVRVVAPRDRLADLSELFGDSYRVLSEVDLLSFGLGISLGLLVGLVPLPLPGGVTFTLGSAGGPLLVGLVLGAVRRTGAMVWTLPYNANLTLRQIGLILFLAAVGLKSGYTFVSTFAQSGGATLLLLGAVVSVVVPAVTIVVGYRVLRVPFGMLTGIVAAVHTQPAILGFATEQTQDDSPNLGWSLAYPVAMISKIVLAQLVITALGGV